MDLTEIFFAIVILLATAKLLGELFRKLKQPALGGEILAGIIVGPTLFGIVQISDGLELISTVAIFFVMLFIGLEMNLSEIRRTGKHALIISVTSLIIPFLVGYQLSIAFGLGLTTSLFVGLLLSVTSVPVSAIILRELKILKTKTGATVISVAIIDDIISLIILAIILQLHVGDIESFNLQEIGISLLSITAYLIGVSVFAIAVYRIEYWLPKRFELFFEKSKSYEVKFGIFIVVAITLSFIAEIAGLHFILGAFFAGLIFSKKIIGSKESEKTFGTISGMTFGFIAPLFFAIIGIKFSAQSLDNYIPFLVLLVLLGVFGKTFGGFIGTKLSKFSNNQGFAISTLLNGRGTVGLTITAVAYSMGILDVTLFSVCVVICIITTMITPIIAKPFLKKISH